MLLFLLLFFCGPLGLDGDTTLDLLAWAPLAFPDPLLLEDVLGAAEYPDVLEPLDPLELLDVCLLIAGTGSGKLSVLLLDSRSEVLPSLILLDAGLYLLADLEYSALTSSSSSSDISDRSSSRDLLASRYCLLCFPDSRASS